MRPPFAKKFINKTEQTTGENTQTKNENNENNVEKEGIEVDQNKGNEENKNQIVGEGEKTLKKVTLILFKLFILKKKRCRNWPNCKIDNCEYSHPTETVKILI